MKALPKLHARRSLPRVAAWLGVACLALAGLASGAAQREGVDEYQLKAALLGKFVRYITWPSDRLAPAGEPFVVAVLGRDPFGAHVDDTFKDRKVEGHPVVVRRIYDLEGLEKAHILFVPRSEAKTLDPVVRATRDAGVLLVSEVPGFALQGGVLNFYAEKDLLRFEINIDELKRQRLKASSDLLKLAKVVTDQRNT